MPSGLHICAVYSPHNVVSITVREQLKHICGQLSVVKNCVIYCTDIITNIHPSHSPRPLSKASSTEWATTSNNLTLSLTTQTGRNPPTDHDKVMSTLYSLYLFHDFKPLCNNKRILNAHLYSCKKPTKNT